MNRRRQERFPEASSEQEAGEKGPLRVRAKIFILPKITGEIPPFLTTPTSSKEGEARRAEDKTKEQAKKALSRKEASQHPDRKKLPADPKGLQVAIV